MILIIDMDCQKDSLGYYEFVLPLVSIAKDMDKFVVKHYSELDLDLIRSCDRILLSGTALKDHESLQHLDLFSWIKRCSKPILGICAGMQTIGLVFDCKLKQCLEIGMQKIVTTRANPLFSSEFQAYELHCYSTQPSREFIDLAKSERCVQAMKHKERDVYGVIFHPEVRNREIVEQFIRLKGTNTNGV